MQDRLLRSSKSCVERSNKNIPIPADSEIKIYYLLVPDQLTAFAAYTKKVKSKNMVKRLLRPTIYQSGLILVDIEADYTYIKDILYLLRHVESICPPLPFCSYLIHNKEALHIIGKLPDLYRED